MGLISQKRVKSPLLLGHTIYALLFVGLNFCRSRVFAIFAILFSQITDFHDFRVRSFLPSSATDVENPSQIWDISPFGDQKQTNGHPQVVDLHTDAKKRPSNCTRGLTSVLLANSDSAQRGINEESSSVQELAAVSVLHCVDSSRVSFERCHFCNL